jgi:chitodextrinase
LTWTIAADTTPPSVPTGLSASQTTINSFILNWSPSTDNVGVTAYQVEVNGTPITTASPVTTTSCEFTGLTPGSTYTVNVKAGDAAGNWSAWSSPLTVTTSSDTTPPTAASGLNYATVGSDTVTLIWNAAGGNFGVAAYQIYRNGQLVGTTSGLTYVDTGLSASTSYTYSIVAVDAAGNVSPASATLTVTTTVDTGLDSDHDGVPDAVEVLLGTNPHSPATIDATDQLQTNVQLPTQ